MKIDSIQNQPINFKRVIKVNYIENNSTFKNKFVVQKGFDELTNVLNNNPTDYYDQKEKEQIKEFFSGIIEDKPKTPVKFFKMPFVGIVMLSGEDSKKIKKVNKIFNKQLSQDKLNKEEKEIYGKIINNLENGKDNKPLSILDVYSSGTSPQNKITFAKIDKFNYSQRNYFYTEIRDGAVREKETNKQTRRNKTQNISYENKFLSLA